jgi:hypothetical protein
MDAVTTRAMDADSLRSLFTKPYGTAAPSAEQWRALYAETVHFQDPTQNKDGLQAFLDAQEGLMRRCDDVYLVPGAVAIDGDCGFIEWEMGLKIKGIEFIYPGVTRLKFNQEGKIIDHRDYFDFVGPTFQPVPVVGGFVRWLYGRFVS